MSVPDTLHLFDLDDKNAERPTSDPEIPVIEFNLQHLTKIAEKGIKHLVADVQLLGFGDFNYVYLLGFQDDYSTVARLP